MIWNESSLPDSIITWRYEFAFSVERGSSEARQKHKLGKNLSMGNSDNSVMLNVKHPRSNKQCTKGAIMLHEKWIPKNLISLDEKYIWHCLELIHNSASSMADAFRTSDELSFPTPIMECSSDDDLCLSKIALVLDCCFESGGQWIIGSILGSMIYIMSRLLQHQGGGDINLRRSTPGSYKELSSKNAEGSKKQYLGLFSSSTNSRNKETTPMEGNVTDSGHHRFASLDLGMLSASPAAPPGASQGLLHVTWKSRIPHFVFSMNDQNEAYITNLTNVGTCSEGSPMYTYFFYSKVLYHREYSPAPAAPHLVGEMKVTTSYSVCPHNSKITEREFVFSKTTGGAQGGSNNKKGYTGLPKKLVDLFRSRFSKRRSKSSFDGNLENPFSESSQVSRFSLEKMKQRSISCFDGGINADLETSFPQSTQVGRLSLDKMKQRSMSSFDGAMDANSETLFPESRRVARRSLDGNLETPFPGTSQEARPSSDNLGHELAAIVVKEQHPFQRHCNQVNTDGGGCGLNFPRKAEARKARKSWDNALLSECCSQNRVMDIIIPTGIHGVPETGNDIKPSTLLERWRSGGKCDCGGWDLGCPITILKTRLTPQNYFDNGKDDLDLFIQGSEQLMPTFSLTKLSDCLYLVHFQPSLSALQSFSIAVAHIHIKKRFE